MSGSSTQWVAECHRCDNAFEGARRGAENPHPHGVFCPECRGKFVASPVLHFRPVRPGEQLIAG